MSNTEKEDSPKEEKGGSKILLVAIVIGVANLAVTGYVATRPPQPAVCANAEHAGEGSSKEARAKSGPTVTLDPFIVNLNETESTRYLKTSVEVELAGAEALEEMTSARPAVRDEMLRYLSSLSVADTMGENGKSKIQDQLTARMDKVLGRGRVRRLFFSEFVVQ